MNNQKGFTLIEMLLYSAIVAIMLTAISGFLILMIQSRIKNQVIAEVDQQGMQVVQYLERSIRNAEGIIIPSRTLSSPSLTLDGVSLSSDPTAFSLNNGVLEVSEGISPIISELTSSQVAVSDLVFSHYSREGTEGIISFQFVVTYDSNSSRQEFDYSKRFYGSATLREN